MTFPRALARHTRGAGRRVTLPLAGHLAFADLEHAGRKSGTVRHTPLRAFRSGNTVIAGLNFRRRSDWYQNINAAGTCRMRLGGEQLTLGAPALVPAAQGVTDLPWLVRFALLHLVHTAGCVQLPILPTSRTPVTAFALSLAREQQPFPGGQDIQPCADPVRCRQALIAVPGRIREQP